MLKNFRDRNAADNRSYAGKLNELSRIGHDLEFCLKVSLVEEAKAWRKTEKPLPLEAAYEPPSQFEIEQ